MNVYTLGTMEIKHYISPVFTLFKASIIFYTVHTSFEGVLKFSWNVKKYTLLVPYKGKCSIVNYDHYCLQKGSKEDWKQNIFLKFILYLKQMKYKKHEKVFKNNKIFKQLYIKIFVNFYLCKIGKCTMHKDE